MMEDFVVVRSGSGAGGVRFAVAGLKTGIGDLVVWRIPSVVALRTCRFIVETRERVLVGSAASLVTRPLVEAEVDNFVGIGRLVACFNVTDLLVVVWRPA